MLTPSLVITGAPAIFSRSEEHTSELQSHRDLHSFPTRRSSDLAHEVGPHVLEGIREMNLLGDAHAVVSDHRSPRHLLEHDVAALRAERHLDGVGELVHSSLEIPTGVLLIDQHFRYERSPPSAGVGLKLMSPA